MLSGLIEEEDEEDLQFERVAQEEAPSIADLRDEERQFGSMSHTDFIRRNVYDDEEDGNSSQEEEPQEVPNKYEAEPRDVSRGSPPDGNFD